MRLESGIDFLSFTLKQGGMQRAYSILGVTPEPLRHKDTGLYGYKFSHVCAGVTLLYSPDRPDVHIQISGSGCQYYGDRILSMVPSDPNQAHVARCDVRCDVLGGSLSVEEIWGYLRRRNYVGSCRTIMSIHSIESDVYAGASVYLGARSSDVRLRIYDKAAEQKTSLDPRRWVRFEFQFRNDAANYAYHDAKLRNESECFLNFLHKTVRLTEKSKDTVTSTNTSMLKTLDKWEKTFGYKIKVVYHSMRKSSTLHGLMSHVRNTGAILKVLRSCLHDFDEMIHGFADDAVLKEHHMQLAYELRA